LDERGIEKWREQLRKGALDLAILLAVAGRERYGLEIIKHLKRETELVVSEGTIYPILARLTRAGSISATWVADRSPHPRKYYALTSEGRIGLDAMLAHWRLFHSKVDQLIARTEEETKDDSE